MKRIREPRRSAGGASLPLVGGVAAGLLLAALTTWAITGPLNGAWPAILLALLIALALGVSVGLEIVRSSARRSIDSVRVRVNDRIASGEIGDLTVGPESDPLTDSLTEDFNILLQRARQRVQVTSTLTSAATTRAAESNLDPLTGLFNRGYLTSHLADEVNRTRVLNDELSVIMLDVDHFKHYNDSQGHPAGDEVLRGVADVLRTSVRALDICVRYGGEEFTILLPRTTLERARRTAERIRQAIETHPFEAREQQPGGALTASLGVASFPCHADDAEALIRRADEALYAAKQGGRNRAMTADEVESDKPETEVVPEPEGESAPAS